MDMQRIGAFLAELRKENNLTQEELGEQIGVTNKTVSRWEKGNYLPPVEMLQILSLKYDVSINEILSGERLEGEKYKTKAEENIASALKNNSIDLKDKKDFLEKKWLNDHLLELILELFLMFSFTILSAILYKYLCVLLSIVCLIWAFWISKRRDAYVENHLYGDRKTQAKTDSDKKSE
ncbi:MAG: helix-turn-helix domain-containing protein [Clostridia bacterium]|nr:helix-turn-helix domain-containing protein [Clostridia bacterium]